MVKHVFCFNIIFKMRNLSQTRFSIGSLSSEVHSIDFQSTSSERKMVFSLIAVKLDGFTVNSVFSPTLRRSASLGINGERH